MRSISPNNFFLLIALFLTAPSLSFAAFAPGETLNPGCLPSDPTCIVIATATNTAAVFIGTSTTATSTIPNLDVTNINISGNVYGIGFSGTNGSTTSSTSTNATSTTLFSTLGRFVTAVVTGTTTTTGLSATFADILTGIFDTLTARVATLYTVTVGSFTATSTANLYGGANTSNLTATGTVNLSSIATGNVSSGALTATGTLSTSGFLSAASSSLGNATATSLNVTDGTVIGGGITAASSTITGTTTAGGLFASYFGAIASFFTHLTAANASITNGTTTNATSTNFYVSGSTTLAAANISALIGGAASFSSTTVSGTQTSGAVQTGSSTVTGTVTAAAFQGGSSTITGTTTTGGLFAAFADLLSAVIATLTSYTGTFGSLVATSSATLASTTLSGNTVMANATATNLYVSGALTTGSPSTFVATTSFSTTTAASSTAVTINTTNLYATNASIENSTSTNSTSSNLYATNATIGNSTTTNSYTSGTISGGNLSVANATATSLNVTNSVAIGAGITAASSTISGTSTTGGIFASFADILTGIFDTLTARVATLYTVTVGSFTATSTANLYGGTQTSNLTATGTTNLSTTYASTLYASTTYATTSNASTSNTTVLNVANGAVTASSTGLTTNNFNAANSLLGAATTTTLYASGGANLNSLRVTGSGTTTFAGPITSETGNFVIAGPTGAESVLLVPYGGSVGIGGNALGKFGIQQGVLTSSENALNISGTWNSGATTFTGMLVNFTDTASAAGSYLANWQVNGSPVFRISKTGTTTIAGGLVAGSTSTFSGIDMNSTRIANLLAPSSGTDAANKSYVDALIQGLSWQAPVDSLATTTITSSTTGDRYIIYSAGGISSTGCSIGNIAENTGIGSWSCTIAATGTTVFVDSFINQSYTYNGTAWNSLGSAIDHASLTGLQGGTASEYYHITATQHGNLTGAGAQLAELKDTGSPTFVGLTTSGTLKSADGSAASSSYTFANDTDTGMYRAGANTIGFATNGVSRMTIDANGNVIMNNSSSSAATSSTLAINTSLDVGNGAVNASSTGLTANTINVTNLNVAGGLALASTTVTGTTTTGGLFALFADLLSAVIASLTSYTGTFGTLSATSSASLASTTLSGSTLMANATATNLYVSGSLTTGSPASFAATTTFSTTTAASSSITDANVTNLYATNATTTNLASIGGSTAASSTISGTTTTGGLYSSFANIFAALLDSITVRVATLYTATVGSLTSTSTANLYGGTQTSNLTATGTTNLSTTYASTLYASTTNASTSNAVTFAGTNITTTNATFTGATTTNFYVSGSFQAALTNGYVYRGSSANLSEATSSLFIANSGNVGIGTTSPSSLLSLHGVANFSTATSTIYSHLNASGNILLPDDSTAGSLLVGVFGNRIYRSSADGSLNIESGQDNVIVKPSNNFIVSQGNVGIPSGNLAIGSTTPFSALTIEKANPYLSFNTPTAGNREGIVFYDNSSIKWTVGNNYDNAGDGNLFLFRNGGAGSILLGPDGTTRIGIGTTSPFSLFSVAGDAAVNHLIPNGTYTNNLSSYDLGATGQRWNALWAGTLNIGTSTHSIKQNSSNGLGFYTAASGGGTEALSISSTGNVGIGVTTPSYKLDVDGTARATGLSLTPTAGTNLGLEITQPGASSGTQVGQYFYNKIKIQSDQYDVTHPTSPFYANTIGFGVDMDTGGINSGGTKTAFTANVAHTGASDVSTGRDTIAATFWARSVASEGGTDTGAGAKGTLFGANPYVYLQPGAINYDTVSGGEVDVGIYSGGSAKRRLGWSVIGIGDMQASTYDAAFEVGAAGTAWKTGILFDSFHGTAPVSTDGCLICTDTTAETVATGLDFSPYAITGNFLKGPNNFVVTGTGSVGVGTTSPGTILAVQGAANFSSATSTIYSNVEAIKNLLLPADSSVGSLLFGTFGNKIYRNSADGSLNIESGQADVIVKPSNNFIVSQGNVGIGDTVPSAALHVDGTVRFEDCPSATLTSDASGNITCTSDERLKNITGSFALGLEAVTMVNPINYNWNEVSGFNTTTSMAGFSAQNVQTAIPQAVGTSTNGYMTFNDRPVLAAVVNAIKEVANITGLFHDKLVAWLAHAANGIIDITASGTVRAQQLCAKSSAGADVCVTGDQLAAVLAGQSSAPTTPPTTNPTSTPAASTSSPQTTLILNGNNPIEWTLNTPWQDNLGALFTHPSGSQTIYSTSTIDTAGPGTTTIEYWAQVPSTGTWLRASRSVVIPQPEHQATDN